MNESGLGEHGCSQASELEPAVMAKLRSYNTDAEVFAFRDGWQAARAKSAERDWNEGFVKGHDLGNTVREIGEDLAAAHKRFGITATGPSKVVPNGWVSVEERLPEVNQQVLLVNVGNFKYGELRNHAFGCLTSWGGLPHYWSIPGEGIIGARSLKAFTHWMPFPAPPEALSAPDQSPEAPETDKRKPNDVELWKSYAQGRADEAEQREADARDAERWLVALKSIAANTCCGSCQEAKKVAMAALRATNHDS